MLIILSKYASTSVCLLCVVTCQSLKCFVRWKVCAKNANGWHSTAQKLKNNTASFPVLVPTLLATLKIILQWHVNVNGNIAIYAYRVFTVCRWKKPLRHPAQRLLQRDGARGDQDAKNCQLFLPSNCYPPLDVKKLDGQRKGQGFRLKIYLAVLTIILWTVFWRLDPDLYNWWSCARYFSNLLYLVILGRDSDVSKYPQYFLLLRWCW